MIKLRILSLLFFLLCTLNTFSQQVLGTFNSNELFEWPNVYWLRDLPNSWDEGLIKTSPNTSGVARSGFGIHLNENRQFTFWSTSVTPLLSIEGASGNTFIRGKLGLGTFSPRAVFDVAKDIGGGQLGAVLGRQVEGDLEGDGTFLGVKGYATQNSMYEGKSFSLEHHFYGQTNSSINFYRGAGSTGGYLTFSTNNNDERMRIDPSGYVGIGTSTPKEMLSVNGKIRAHEIKVETSNWPDYVFEKDFKLSALEELESYIKTNKHLPEIPSATEVEKDGVALGEMNKLLLKKLEELTLHLIDKDKEIQYLKNAREEDKIQSDTALSNILERLIKIEKTVNKYQ